MELKRILVHDFAGHAFPVQLSRELARRGHSVAHVYCPSFDSGRGLMAGQPNDPATLTVRPIDLGSPFAKYSPVERARQEIRYARDFRAELKRFEPDVVLDSNPALLAKLRTGVTLCRQGTPWVYWLQDVASVAMREELTRRLRGLGRLVAVAPQGVESWLLRQASAVISITPDFDTLLDAMRVPPERRHVIPNWAPVDQISHSKPDRTWAAAHGIHGDYLVLYAGTLGLKHNPSILLDLAVDLAPLGVDIVVASQGAGADFLRDHLQTHPNLRLVPYQPFETFNAMLASSDATICILNEAAGAFSVPSKILAYLCAGRPVVAAMPDTNQIARVLVSSGAGMVVRPNDRAALASVVSTVLLDESKRAQMGRAGRSYAEQTFGIESIVAKFEQVLATAAR